MLVLNSRKAAGESLRREETVREANAKCISFGGKKPSFLEGFRLPSVEENKAL